MQVSKRTKEIEEDRHRLLQVQPYGSLVFSESIVDACFQERMRKFLYCGEEPGEPHSYSKCSAYSQVL